MYYIPIGVVWWSILASCPQLYTLLGGPEIGSLVMVLVERQEGQRQACVAARWPLMYCIYVPSSVHALGLSTSCS